MKIWLVEISDFLPKIDGKNRLYRVGMLAEALVTSGHQVLWWTSTFNHQLRRQRYDVSTTIDIQKNYRLRLVYGPGYKRSISFDRWKHNRAVAKEFAREIVEVPVYERPDLIYTCLPTLEVSEQAVLFGLRNDIPVVVDIRDQWPDIYLSPLPKQIRPLFRILLKTEFSRVRRILNQATAIIGVSATNLRWGLRLAKRNARPIDTWFPHGVPLKNNQDGKRDKVQKEKILSKWGIKEDCLIVTFVGTFSQLFNLVFVVKVAKFFEKAMRKVVFVLVGDGSNASSIRRLATGLKNVVFTGWLDKSQIDQILSISSVGLAPYSADGLVTLPNKPFEYMAAGLPILSSLDGELRAIIERESIGLYYNANDPNELRERLNWLLSHPEKMKTMGQKARALFEKEYNSEKIYASLVTHLGNIAANKGGVG